jgi:hypothetical protein
LEQCTVEYKELEGWQKPTTKAKTWYDLPAKARAYVEFIEEFVGVKVRWDTNLIFYRTHCPVLTLCVIGQVHWNGP